MFLRAPWIREPIERKYIGPDGKERVEIEFLVNEAENIEFEIPPSGLVEINLETSTKEFESLDFQVGFGQ